MPSQGTPCQGKPSQGEASRAKPRSRGKPMQAKPIPSQAKARQAKASQAKPRQAKASKGKPSPSPSQGSFSCSYSTLEIDISVPSRGRSQRHSAYPPYPLLCQHASHRLRPQRAPPPAAPAEDASLSQRFLCLSRACLGKMIVLSIKRRTKEAFSVPAACRGGATFRSAPNRGRNSTPRCRLGGRRCKTAHARHSRRSARRCAALAQGQCR
jgi:hypothetical protein